jgi:hypothetical protein
MQTNRAIVARNEAAKKIKNGQYDFCPFFVGMTAPDLSPADQSFIDPIVLHRNLLGNRR